MSGADLYPGADLDEEARALCRAMNMMEHQGKTCICAQTGRWESITPTKKCDEMTFADFQRGIGKIFHEYRILP